jgi:hypothetical protein
LKRIAPAKVGRHRRSLRDDVCARESAP